MTDFEEKLKQYFPEIYAIYILAKDVDKGGGGEKHILTLIEQMLKMSVERKNGSILINYTQGRINQLSVKQELISGIRAKRVDNAE